MYYVDRRTTLRTSRESGEKEDRGRERGRERGERDLENVEGLNQSLGGAVDGQEGEFLLVRDG